MNRNGTGTASRGWPSTLADEMCRYLLVIPGPASPAMMVPGRKRHAAGWCWKEEGMVINGQLSSQDLIQFKGIYF